MSEGNPGAGSLAAAIYDPVWTTAVGTPADFAAAAAAFSLLTVGRASPWAVVCLMAAGGSLLTSA